MTERSAAARRLILERLRSALDGSRRVFRDDGMRSIDIASLTPVTGASSGAQDLARTFGEKLQSTNGSYEIVAHASDVVERVAQLVTEWSNAAGARRVLSWSPNELTIPNIDARLDTAGISLHVPKDLRSELSDAEQIRVGLTSADAAFASTGSLLLIPGPGKSRAASLLPLYHLVVVPIGRIHPTFEAWVRGLRRTQRLEGLLRDHAQIVFVTGPSKSADIELNLTLGVHGPRVVHAIVFDETS